MKTPNRSSRADEPSGTPTRRSWRGWCDDHWVPRTHFCLLDRDCRSVGAPKRGYLFWGRYSVLVDLPERTDGRWYPPQVIIAKHGPYRSIWQWPRH